MRKYRWLGLLAFLLLSSCSKHHSLKVLGYIEGRYVYLSSPVSGTLTNLAVQKGETVKANQLAFQLDPQPELSELQNAQAQLASSQQDLENLKVGERSTIIKRLQALISQAQANVVYSKKMYDRNAELRKTFVVGQAAVDQWRAQFEADTQKLNEAQANLAEGKLGARTNLIASQEAKVQAAKAQVDQYQWMVSQKTMHFAQMGFVQDTLFRQNEYVTAGKPIVSFLPPENRILIFFVPEKNLSQVRIDQTVYFTCDGCAKNISAKINYIASDAEYTPPVIYSKDSREKLVYWVEAKIDPAVVTSMHPGEPVEVAIQ